MKVSPGTLILGIFAVLFGLVGAYYAKYHLRQEEPVAQPQPEQPRIVPRAGVDLAAGRTVTLGDVMLVSMTREQITKAAFPHPYMAEPSQIIGRTLREEVPKGSVFQLASFYPEGLGPSVAERLRPGYRAITVPLTNSAAELAMVTPGMDVDIVFRSEADPKAAVPETTVTLLERVEVLAIGEETFAGAKSPSLRDDRGRSQVTVTLAVTPEQAGALKVVEGHGTMSLVIRGESDESLVGNVGPQTLAGLLELPPPKPPVTTQIYRRGQLTTMVFEGDQPHAVVSDIPGLPVAAAGRRPSIHSVSQSTVSTSGQDDSNDCGCGSKAD